MRILRIVFLTLLFLLCFSTLIPVYATDEVYIPTVIYIDEAGCPECTKIRDFGIVNKLELEGIVVLVYDIHRDTEIALAYNFVYGFGNKASSGVIFAGESAFRGYEEIKQGFEQGLIQQAAQTPLFDISGFNPDDIELFRGWRGVFEAVTIGLLDGFNPCAIAMLLMFISIIGFIKTRRVMLVASISYIFAIFLTYILLGVAFIFLIDFATSEFTQFKLYLYLFFTLLAFFLFGLTFYDVWVTRAKAYEKVKAQMPSAFKRFNQRIMERFTSIIQADQRNFKFYLFIVIIPFVVGIIVALVEAVCTGTPYLFFLQRIQTHYTQGQGITFYEISLLVIFNMMFVMPLIIIAIIAIVTQSIAGVSSFILKRMTLIKLLTSIFFLLMAVYFAVLVIAIIS
jgi:hypothetical protein